MEYRRLGWIANENIVEAGGLLTLVAEPAPKPDAQHIALATLAEADCLVSWNFKHILKDWRIEVCRSVNAIRNHQSIDIMHPGEIEYDE